MEIMGIKRNARPINKAKNLFLKWLNKNKAEYVDDFEGGINYPFQYYRHVTALIGTAFYSVYFIMIEDEISINYADDENKYYGMTIDDFLSLIN